MQIHELTQKKTQQVDEGIGSTLGSMAGKVAGGINKVGTAVASPFRDAAAGYRGGKVDAKTASIADKAYRSWSAYRQQLDKNAPGGKADPATIEKQLMAFVSKNLLGGQYLPNLINKDQIIGLVKQIAGSNVATQAPAKIAAPAGTKPPATTGARMGKAGVTKPPAGKTPPATTPPGKTAPGAGAFGAMTNQLGGTAGATSTGGTATPTATGVKNTASATNPNQPPPPGGNNPAQKMQAAMRPDGSTQAIAEPVKAPVAAPGLRAGKVPSTPAGTAPVTEPISIGGQKLNPKNPKDAELIKKLQPTIKEALQPAQELELFKKLVATAAQAQSEVATGATGAGSGPGAGVGANVGGKKVQTPKQMIGAVTQALGPTVDAGKLKAAGDAIRKNFQIDASIGSTDDDAVDALLMTMGFQPA